MASQAFASCKVTLFRGFNLLRCSRLGFVKPKWSIQDYARYRGRLFLTSTCPANQSDDTNNFEKHKEGLRPSSRQRDDLERLKQLLQRGKSSNADSNEPHINQKKAKAKQAKKSPNVSVNVEKFKDILSSLTVKQETQLPPSKESGLRQKSLTSMPSEAETIKKETRKPTKNVVRHNQQLDVSKIKDALSILGQDRSFAPTEDVILAGRHQQISPETLSAMEGVLTIKQRQIRDKDSKEKMPQNSLRTGPRLHWFDDVKTEWSVGASSPAPTLFQEMAEKEVSDMDSSVSVQSGFQDLIESIDRQWSFPIDNETCKTEEENVGFDQHVFLEYTLNEFPKSGNIHQFMELVITGLQQNPHLNVKEKNGHILWFKEYFENMPDELVHL